MKYDLKTTLAFGLSAVLGLIGWRWPELKSITDPLFNAFLLIGGYSAKDRDDK